IAELPLRVLGGSRAEVSSMDCRKRQTPTATPAKPGELPYGLDAVMGRASRAWPDWVAVPQNDGVETESRAIGSKHQVRNSHGILCRNRRVFERKGTDKLTWKMHRFGRIERKALMLRMIEIASQISGVFAKRPSTNDSPWLLSGL
ncbi:MAG: hypothetical protein WBO09_14640, partial [Methylocystis silviterrae]|uniref:hypothetical protein n=1 Tax=Methylocystis silviterrae TaxID=2743612 RepID=UPI003C7504B4